jgi:glutamate synthase domain-containing protein 3
MLKTRRKTMKSIDAKNKDLRVVNREIRDNLNDLPVKVVNANHLHGLVTGIKHGEVIIESDTGDYLGVLNDGATIKVTENVGNYLADNMTTGTIVVEGNSGFGAAQYCYGGTVVIRGDAGDFTATMNKGAAIIIGGDVGDEAGTYMLDGDLIVLGNAGKNFANYLIRGDIYIQGEWETLGHNTRIVEMDERDVEKLTSYFNIYGIEADPHSFKKIVAASKKPFYK